MIFQTEDDLDPAKIAESGQCFRWEPAGAGYRIIAHGRCLRIAPADAGRLFSLSCGQEEFDRIWKDYFDLETSYRAVRARIDPERDPFLFRASQEERGIRILRQDPWETLVSFIISQNRNIPAIRRSVRLLCGMCGEKRADSAGETYFTFPEPEAVASLSGEELCACRLGYRARYVHDAAVKCMENPDRLESLREAPEEDTIRSLMEICGVGVKVANCESLFGLHHLNAFPVDVWMKRVLSEHYPDGYPFEKYSPYNGIYQQYMFAWYRDISPRKRS